MADSSGKCALSIRAEKLLAINRRFRMHLPLSQKKQNTALNAATADARALKHDVDIPGS